MIFSDIYYYVLLLLTRPKRWRWVWFACGGARGGGGRPTSFASRAKCRYMCYTQTRPLPRVQPHVGVDLFLTAARVALSFGHHGVHRASSAQTRPFGRGHTSTMMGVWLLHKGKYTYPIVWGVWGCHYCLAGTHPRHR
jgi:hypothetical protein